VHPVSTTRQINLPIERKKEKEWLLNDVIFIHFEYMSFMIWKGIYCEILEKGCRIRTSRISRKTLISSVPLSITSSSCFFFRAA